MTKRLFWVTAALSVLLTALCICLLLGGIRQSGTLTGESRPPAQTAGTEALRSSEAPAEASAPPRTEPAPASSGGESTAPAPSGPETASPETEATERPPAETVSATAEPTEAEPEETESMEPENTAAEPIETEPEALPDETEPAETEPVQTEPAGPEDPVRTRALELLAGMTEHEKLCQLMIVSPDTITGVSPTRRAGDVSKAALERYPVGGFSFSQNNLTGRQQVISMLEGFDSFCKIPLFFCLDEEGGTVWRVMKNPDLGTTRVGSMYDYRAEGPETAYANAKTIGGDIAALGFNVDFAPVADVWTNPDNTVIGKRAYSDSFAQAAELIPAAVRGFHDGGVACTLKHFPGHGDTAVDSHKGLPTVERSAEELREGELLPFRAGLEAGADLVMVGHLLVPDLDPDYPATLSPAIVNGLLRGELGFSGVVITDSLGMGALDAYGEGRKCVLALQAGCDILLGVQNVPGALEALREALDAGELTWARIDESVLRILELKLRRGILS